MNTLYYIGQDHCGDCNKVRDELIEPLRKKHPECVKILYKWCDDIARINKRKEIDRVPLFVLEDEKATKSYALRDGYGSAT